MTIIGPILMGGLIVAPTFLSHLDKKEIRTVAVIDQTKVFSDTVIDFSKWNNAKALGYHISKKEIMHRRLPDTKYIKFQFLSPKTTIDSVKRVFNQTGYYALLFIPENLLTSQTVKIYSTHEISMNVKMYLSKFFDKELEREKLKAKKIDPDIIKSIRTSIDVSSVKWTSSGEQERNSDLAMLFGMFAGFLIYFFVFMFSAQVMRGVIEEKTNRIVEIIISSVKPFQLMMGKIVGIAMVGLTQFLLWIVLTFSILVIVQQKTSFSTQYQNQKEIKSLLTTQTSSQLQPTIDVSNEVVSGFVKDVMNTVLSINWWLMIGAFLFYFLSGYLLYASLFSAVGAAVDSETDTQQFMMPLTVPLLLSLIMVTTFIENPDGDLAFWFSIIPFTSPIVMMVRIPFGVSFFDMLLSMGLLLLTIYIIILLSAKVYRIGILVYGKKTTYRDIFKWLRY
jgi:ABC-2 type transport system permease protein